MADFTLLLIFCAFSRNSARRLSETSSEPAASPARVMFTYRLSKTFGYCESASENVAPPSTDSHMPCRIVLSAGTVLCFARMRRPRSSGRPDSTSVASWRVRTVRSLLRTRLDCRNAGIFSSTFRPPFFLPPELSGTRDLATRSFWRRTSCASAMSLASTTPRCSLPAASFAT